MLPVILSTSFFTLYAYPLFMGLSWGAGYFLTRSLFDKYAPVESKSLFWLFLGLFISSWIGAKVFFLYFSSTHKIYQYLYAEYFWLGGGFVFYGGLIFGLLFYLFYSFVLKKFNHEQSSLLIPGLALGHCLGRVGCFLTGCCYGSPTTLPWAVRMQDELRHPVQLYEAIALLTLGCLSLNIINKRQGKTHIVLGYLIGYSAIRFIIEFYRGDEIRGIMYAGFSTSQIVSVVIFLISCSLIIYLRKKNT